MKKGKLLLSIVSLCFAIAVLTFGVFAANSASYMLSGTMSYTVSEAFIRVEADVYSFEDPTYTSLYSKIDDILTGDYTDLTKIQGLNLAYNSLTESKTNATRSLNLTFGTSGSPTQKPAYFVVYNVTNLGQNPIWIDATKLPTLPDNVYSVNSGIQTNVAYGETKKLVIALAIEDIETAVASTNYNVELYAEEGTYNRTSGSGTLTKNSTTLTELIIPAYVNGVKTTTVGDFSNLSSCTKIVVPDTVTLINAQCFAGASSLQDIYIPFVGVDRTTDKTVTSIFGHIFEQDNTASNLNFVVVNQKYTWSNSVNVIFPKSLNKVFVTSATNISSGAFTSIKELQNLEIYFSRLCTFDTLKKDSGASAIIVFTQSSSISSIVFPKSVTNFNGWTAGENIINLKIMSGNVYDSRDNCNAIIESATNKLVIGCNTTIIPSSVSILGSYSFSGCTFSSIIIPNSVKEIQNNCFSNCVNLTAITLPSNLSNLGSWCFYGCSSLNSVIIYSNITSIEMFTFAKCNISYMVMSVSVNEVKAGAFRDGSLSALYYMGNTSNWSTLSSNISADNNSALTSATRYYYSESTPAESNVYWHYVNNVPTVWVV